VTEVRAVDMSLEVLLGPDEMNVAGVSGMNSPPPERYQQENTSRDKYGSEEQAASEEFETIERPEEATPIHECVPLLTRLNDVNGNRFVHLPLPYFRLTVSATTILRSSKSSWDVSNNPSSCTSTS
jgi:hypothetical protein